jgi:2',3'-cyclic-nucleotide 2'-phosphodiesterase (5'-nucleotidase family)
MNTIGFDAMAIGNHEFDWGLETILNYRDGKSINGEANFPILGANILYDDTNELPEYVEPYTIIERGGLTIGIVGYIGYGLEDSIATKMIDEFYFAMPVDVVAPLVTEMRLQKGCDVVIAVGHDGSDANNKALANLSGDAKIDAIVNGHLHLESASFVTSTDGRKVPVVQAGSSGECVGVINFEVNQETQSISNPTVTTVTMDGSKPTNSKLDKYIDKIVKDTEPFFGRVLGVAGEKISVSSVRLWAPNVVQKYMSVDVAFVNSGGIRADAFPINKDEEVDVAKVYQIMPFDNIIKTCELKGSDIRKILNNSNIMYSNTVVRDGSKIFINGKELDNDTYYTVATVDYLFDKTEHPFQKGQNIKNEGIFNSYLLW